MTKRTVGVADTTYTYNQEDQLVRIDYPNQEYSTYKYDALGRRIEKRDRAGNIKRFYYDGFDLVAGYDGSNNLIANTTFGPGIDNPISLNYDGDIYYYHTDALGSVTEMTDANEDVAQSYEYSAFGEILTQSGSLTYINPFTYTARELDNESGLYYYRYRYYSPDIGRFITYDPIYWAGGFNLYTYVRNNPIGLTDALGLGPGWKSWVTGIAAVAIGVGLGLALTAALMIPVSWTVMAVGGAIAGIGVVALWLTSPKKTLEEVKEKGKKPIQKRKEQIEKELGKDFESSDDGADENHKTIKEQVEEAVGDDCQN